MKFHPFAVGVLAGACIAAATDPAVAQSKLLGEFESWDAAVITSGKSKSCYAASLPAKKDTKAKRGEASLMVMHWPGRKRVNMVRVNAGYTYKKNAPAVLRIDKKAYKLFTRRGSAWAETSKLDLVLIKAMKGGTTATVEGTTAKGTKTVDTYALKGFAKALAAINKECGVK